MVREINALELGIDVNGEKIALLLYADDIVLLSDNETNMQTMLNTLHEWCKKWRVLINTEKSKSVQFRIGRRNRSDFVIRIGQNIIETVDKYRYLGVIFHEKMDFSFTAGALAKGVGRALCGIISKIHSLKEFGFKTFEKLYYACVVPILDYGYSVWGYKPYVQIDNVLNRAMRYFLGVHRFTPNLANTGEMGWLPSVLRRWDSMIRFWNRMLLLDDTCLTKRVFNHDYNVCQKNWCEDLKRILTTIGLSNGYENKLTVNMTETRDSLLTYYANSWPVKCQNVPKLRTYLQFKQSFKTEKYLTMNLTRSERSVMAQFRCGVLPLRIETGWFVGEQVGDRLCRFCDLNLVEDEKHFLLVCPSYVHLRDSNLGTIINNEFRQLTDDKKLCLLFDDYTRKTAKYLLKAFLLRRGRIFETK